MLLRTCCTLSCCALFTLAGSIAQATDLLTATPTLVQSSQFFPVSQASDGNVDTQWVTNAFVPDYYVGLPTPVILFDLGQDTLLDGVALWNYSVPGNGTRNFSLQFATEADGSAGLGTSITYNPSYTVDPTLTANSYRQDRSFGGQQITARYVQMTITDNGFGFGAGGDRVGFRELQFSEGANLTSPLVTASASLVQGSQFFPVGQASDGNVATTWVTDAPGGGTADYFALSDAIAPDPILQFDLGESSIIEGFTFNNYPVLGNRTTAFTLEFSEDGTTFTDLQEFFPLAVADSETQNFMLDQPITAQFVRMTITDNAFAPGAGGDRVGFAEIQFAATPANVPEPAACLVFVMGLAAAGLYRRRAKA